MTMPRITTSLGIIKAPAITMAGHHCERSTNRIIINLAGRFTPPPFNHAAVALSLSSSHAHHGKGQQFLNWYPSDQRSGGNGALSFGGDSYRGDGYSGITMAGRQW